MMYSMKAYSRVAWIIIAFILAGWWYFHYKDTQVVNGTILERPQAAPLFSLTGIDGRVFDERSLSGHWTMLFFGFTHCDSVCPTRLMELAKMIQILERKNISDLPHVMMISLDPERDSLFGLKTYVQSFNPGFYAATGSKSTLARLELIWGISANTVIKHQSDGTLIQDIEHSSTVMVFNPNGALVAFLTSPSVAEQLANDFLIISKPRNK